MSLAVENATCALYRSSLGPALLCPPWMMSLGDLVYGLFGVLGG